MEEEVEEKKLVEKEIVEEVEVHRTNVITHHLPRSIILHNNCGSSSLRTKIHKL